MSHCEWSGCCYFLLIDCLLESLSPLCRRLKSSKTCCKPRDSLYGLCSWIHFSSWWYWSRHPRRMLWTKRYLRIDILRISCSIHINVSLQLHRINLEVSKLTFRDRPQVYTVQRGSDVPTSPWNFVSNYYQLSGLL